MIDFMSSWPADPVITNVITDSFSLGFRIVFCPYFFEFIQVMRTQYGPIPCEVVKVVHDNSDKEVDNLRRYTLA